MKVLTSLAQIIRAWLLPLVALFMMVVVGKVVFDGQPNLPKTDPLRPPAAAPDAALEAAFVAGSGIVEPRSEIIAINSPVTGLVIEVKVKVGDVVKRGEVLFTLESSVLAAELSIAESAVTVLHAQQKSAEIDFTQAQRERDRATSLLMSRALAAQEVEQRMFAAEVSAAKIETLNAQLHQAKATAQKAAAQLAQHRVIAPIGGTIVQLRVRAGETVAVGRTGEPLVSLADISTLHVRADIDEDDLSRFNPKANATVSPHGDPARKLTCQVVHIEPLVIPKKSLTNSTDERVDTRVLQAIYAIPAGNSELRIGQQVDVFTAARSPSASTSNSKNP
ncbi:MAG: hypothetical protein RL693_2447 [Verrucomicrobiota bacterium]|jgi:RND family efflux transporter MFP subunit